MSIYEYIALDEKGRQRKGFLDATGAAAARQQLREQGVYPVEVHQAQENKSASLSGMLEISLSKKVSAKEISVFTRQLSTLLGAGIPLVPSSAGRVESASSVCLGSPSSPGAAPISRAGILHSPDRPAG